MKKPLPLIVFSLMLLLSPLAAVAQTAPMTAPPVPATPSEEAASPPSDQAVAPAASAATPETLPAVPPADITTAPEPAPPTVEDRLSSVEGKTEGMDESLSALQSTVGKLSKIKVSGYVQGRFESRANSANGVNAQGRPQTTNQFLVRRGRLKVTYDGTNAEYMLQIDATGSGVALRDAEATLVDTWSPFGFRLTMGQFKSPFGYEVLQSSGDREMPERSLVIRSLFPGERDRGLRLTGRYEWLRFAFALVNGTGIQDPIYPANDSNTFKDLVGRVSGDFEFLVVGVSGYLGRNLKTTLPTAMTAASYQRFRRARVGIDAQLYFDIPMVGGLALKYEGVLAKDTNLEYGATAANPCLNVTSVGHIVTGVLNVGDYLGLVARFDTFDPNFSKSLNDSCTAQITNAQGDRTDTFGAGVLVHVSGNLKGTIVYEHIGEQSKTMVNGALRTLENDIFTAQLQARF